MSVQQEEPEEEVYVEHQYMCSECHQLFNTLEEVLQHQQSHVGPEEEEAEHGAHLSHLGEAEDGDTNYQCLECGALLRNPEELLLHQEMHMREAGLDAEHEVCEVLEADPGVSGPVQYQCLECLALFPSPELWLQHRHTHSKSSTHSQHSNTEYVVQADGSVTPLVNVQNLVLDEQRAGEILAQVLAQQQQTGPSRALLPPVAPLAGSATLRLQICSAQALADAHTHTHTHTPANGSSGSGPLRRSRLLPPLLASTAAPTHTPAHTPNSGRIHPYECSECSLEFSTPEDFLAHQGEHFLCQEKESAEGGLMDERDALESDRTAANKAATLAARQPITGRSAPDGGVSLQCGECQRTFTSANRLAAHRRVHEQGTHECPECGKVFKKAGSLQTHLRSHSGEARYLCVDCGHGFTTEMTLIIHRKSHTAEPLHRCEFCAKTFTNMTKFLYHRRTHTARPPLTAVSTVFVPPRRIGPALSLQERLRERQRVGLMQTSQSEPQAGGSEVLSQPPGLIAPMSEADLEAESSQEAAALAKDRYGNITKQNGVAVRPAVAPPVGEQQESISGCTASREKVPEAVAGSAKEEEASFPCPACGKAFRSPLRLVRHRRTVHVAERLFRCGVCAKPFKKQIHVQNHLRTHTGERPFQCSDCGKTFASLANLSRHTLTHTGERPYRCSVCSRAFSQSSNLRQHQLLHTNTPPSRCPDCPATFRRASKLTAHRHTHHQGPAPYPCPHCPEGFLRKRLRDLHCHTQHPQHTHTNTHNPQDGEVIGSGAPTPQPSEVPDAEKAVAVSRPFLDSGEMIGSDCRPSLDCSICRKRLNSASNLRLHMLSHVGTGSGRGHQCSVCGKAFVSASGLTLHRRVHTGERPFPCGVCGKRFRQNTHLREHLRTHSGERPFRCETCGKGFVQSMHLAEHRRTHTGERPHACHCGKAFKTISNLRNHQKIHTRALQQQQQQAEEGGRVDPGETGETGAAVAVLDAASVLDGAVELSAAVPALCQQGALGQPQLIHIQTSDLAQGAPTIMCNEFGEAIAIIETREGAALPLAEALEIYQTALESSITIDNLQLL